MTFAPDAADGSAPGRTSSAPLPSPFGRIASSARTVMPSGASTRQMAPANPCSDACATASAAPTASTPWTSWLRMTPLNAFVGQQSTSVPAPVLRRDVVPEMRFEMTSVCPSSTRMRPPSICCAASPAPNVMPRVGSRIT